MAGEGTATCSAVTSKAASPVEAGKPEIESNPKALHPSLASNKTPPSLSQNFHCIAAERQPSVAHRRLQTSKAVSGLVPSISLKIKDAHCNLFVSTDPALPFRIDLDRPPVSVRETFGSSQSELQDGGEKLERKLGWNERVRHYTWIFFQTSMATGGVANVLHTVPFRFLGLDAIGAVFFILNLFLFFMNCVAISIRFALHPATFKASLLHPTESLFVPCSVLALGTLILNIAQYGLGNTGTWLEQALVVLFWLYVSIVVTSSVSIYLVIWSTQTFDIANMTPTWVFPAMPFLLVGPLAGYLSNNLPGSSINSSTTASPSTSPTTLLFVLLIGLTCQGIGFLITLFLYSAFYCRLMTQKLPERSTRPSIFMSAGLSGFTCIAIVSMASGAALVLPHITTSGNSNNTILADTNLTTAIAVIRVVAVLSVLPFYGLASWFFLVSVGAYWDIFVPRRCAKLRFSTTWLSFIFPNTPFISATFAVGEAFDADPIRWAGCVLSVLVAGMWGFVFVMMLRAVIRKELLRPDQQKDWAETKAQTL